MKFVRYSSEEARKRSLYDIAPPKDDLPIGLKSSRASIIVQAGFDPDSAKIWLLPFDWGNHKKGCIVVVPDLEWQTGSFFAISEEPVEQPPDGGQGDDGPGLKFTPLVMPKS